MHILPVRSEIEMNYGMLHLIWEHRDTHSNQKTEHNHNFYR